MSKQLTGLQSSLIFAFDQAERMKLVLNVAATVHNIASKNYPELRVLSVPDSTLTTVRAALPSTLFFVVTSDCYVGEIRDSEKE